MEDKYLSEDNCYLRLRDEYTKYEQLIVAVDFDNTLFDFHSKGETYPKLEKLLRDCKKLNMFIIIYTARNDLDFIEKYMLTNNLPYDTINCNAPFIQTDGLKLYYSILLDDRAGLPSAYKILNKLIQEELK